MKLYWRPAMQVMYKVVLVFYKNLFLLLIPTAIADLLEDDGKSAPKRLDIDWERQTVYLPFTSTSSGSKGVEHTHRSLVASFFSPDGTANHWFDQLMGDSVVCGNWFFHTTGLYAFALAAMYGISMYTQSDYSDNGLLDAIVDNRVATATMYSWQVFRPYFSTLYSLLISCLH
jgi:acyl-CoA synthetase (AMP-forming)/AMP-acid ligase II